MAVTDDTLRKFPTTYGCSTYADSPVYGNIAEDEAGEPLVDTGFIKAAQHVWVVCQVSGRPNPESPATQGNHNERWLYTQGDRRSDSASHHGRVYGRAWGYLPANVVKQGGRNEPVPGVPVCPEYY